MPSFWRLAKHLLHERSTLFWAMVFAFLSAGGLAAGLAVIGPILKLIFNDEGARGLDVIAREFNAEAAQEASWLTIPDWLVQRLPSDPFQGVVLLMAVIAALTVFGAIANFLHQYLSQTVTTRAVARIRRDAFDNVIHMPLGRVVSRGPSEFIARIVRDSAELQRGMIALVSKAVTSLFKGLAAIIIAFLINWQLTLVAIPTALVLGAVLRKLGKRIRRGTRGSLKAQEGLLRVATESLQGLRAVKAGTAEHESLRRFDEINREAVRHELKVRTARALSAPVVESLAVFVVIALAIIAAKGILAGAVKLDEFMQFLLALGMAGASLRPITGLINEIQAASAPAERLADILDEPREPDGAPAPAVATTGRHALAAPERGHALPRHSRSIEFRNVTFTYPSAANPALNQIDLNILHGEKIAIVGPNGCGKTTLLSLLPRLLVPDPNGGAILIDGRDIATVDLRSLRGQIGVVTQETVLFRGSILQNIAFGQDDAALEQVMDAAKRAHADEFIQQLPGAYDADVFEQGQSLSGGQRQRLAIARAILRDPTILILDEATSQIDAESEAHINQALAEFCANRTALLIAHRLSTVLASDRIVVMEAGRIIDQGRHEQLFERCELYRGLSRTQLVAADS